jgi:hypothetical protein
MKRHLAPAGKGLASIGLATLLTYAVSIAVSGTHNPPTWPYWLCGSVLAAGVAMYFAGQERREPALDAVDSHGSAGGTPPPPPGPAITDRWRNINNGFEAGAMMRLRDYTLFHPAYTNPPPPSMRTATRIACAPLAASPPTSDIRARFLAFLRSPAVSALLAALTTVSDDTQWTSWNDRPRSNFAAILTGPDTQSPPVAWAQITLPESGASHLGADPRAALLVIHIYPRTPQGDPAPAAGLPAWHQRLGLALTLPSAFADFLAHDLGLATTNDPLAQAGVSLDTPQSITQLIDPEDLQAVPGTTPRSTYMGWALAEPDGEPTPGLIHQWLTQICDNTLYVTDYEPTLQSLQDTAPPAAADNSTEPSPSTAPGPPPPSPGPPSLTVSLLDGPVWEAWQHHSLIVAFHLQVTNTTNVPMQVKKVGHGWTWPTEHGPNDEEQTELARELHRRRERDHYGPPLRIRAPLPPHASASGWLITSMNQDPRGGTPEITIAVTDAIGNEYKHVIPAQPATRQAPADASVPSHDPM